MITASNGALRVNASELTYPAHVILRFEIERSLITEEIKAEDIPAVWATKMQDYLGVDVAGNYENGCMQDIHWPMGMFGYFPSYTLGAMYAAQYFATIRKMHPDMDTRIASGDAAAPVIDWLDANIWSQASRWPTDELVKRATGELRSTPATSASIWSRVTWVCKYVRPQSRAGGRATSR